MFVLLSRKTYGVRDRQTDTLTPSRCSTRRHDAWYVTTLGYASPPPRFFASHLVNENNPGAATKKQLASMPHLQLFPKDQPQLAITRKQRDGASAWNSRSHRSVCRSCRPFPALITVTTYCVWCVYVRACVWIHHARHRKQSTMQLLLTGRTLCGACPGCPIVVLKGFHLATSLASQCTCLLKICIYSLPSPSPGVKWIIDNRARNVFYYLWVNIGTPENGHPECPFSRKYTHPDAHIYVNMALTSLQRSQ